MGVLSRKKKQEKPVVQENSPVSCSETAQEIIDKVNCSYQVFTLERVYRRLYRVVVVRIYSKTMTDFLNQWRLKWLAYGGCSPMHQCALHSYREGVHEVENRS